MIKLFFDWFESLGWQAALCFMFALCAVMVILVLLVDWIVRGLIERRELAAIKARTWEQKKVRAASIIEERRVREQRDTDDAEFLRRLNIDIANDDAQTMRERKQFHLPPAFRDMKGLHR